MTTLTRSTSRSGPTTYKDYVNFLGAYKNKNDNSSTDVPDFSKSSCVSYNAFLENTKNKKFTTVKPNLNEKKTERSEIFIEIQPPVKSSVSEISKNFENKEKSPPPPPSKTGKINEKIDIFERQNSGENKPKLATKPLVVIKPPSPPPPVVKVATPPPPPPPATDGQEKTDTSSPPPPPPMIDLAPKQVQNGSTPPPPPPMVNLTQSKVTVPKMQATLTKGPQIKHAVNNPNNNRVVPGEIDRNDPMVRKLVYGTLRGLYGAYHDKANDIMATLPKNRVKKSNGVQDIIEKIASSGDLDKLNGRVNPKLEQE